MKKAVYFLTKTIKEAVYDCRRKVICTVYELGTDKALADFTDSPVSAERQALKHIEQNGWHNVSYDPKTKTVTSSAEATIEELAGNTMTSLKKMFAKKIAGTVYKRLTAMKYTIVNYHEYCQTIIFTVTAKLGK